MAQLSPARAGVPTLEGLPLIHRGKVRDTYALSNNLMLVVATDAVSIFDFVLNALVPMKGAVLTAMSHFWFQMLEERGFRTHFVAAGGEVDRYLPDHLRGNSDLQSRAMVVKRLRMHPVEFIARQYLTGSGLTTYKESRTVCGHRLPEGLQDGDRLPWVLDTPTTKAEEGHDEALDAFAMRRQYPMETFALLDIFRIISQFAEERGILFADTKFEFGLDEEGNLVLGDEVATADSSRWWDKAVWQAGRNAAERKAPPPFDKQLVRAYGLENGMNPKMSTTDPENTKLAHSLELPRELIEATTATYRYILWRLLGERLETYFDHKLAVKLPEKKVKVAIVAGSESDLGQIRIALEYLRNNRVIQQGLDGAPVVHVISCHRNPVNLEEFASSGCRGANVVIATGSKALALPGQLDALLHSKGKKIPVIGVALGEKGNRAFEAAKLSIEEIPGQPVIMDEVQGEVYANLSGLRAALERIACGELPPPKPRTEKPARFDIEL